MLAALRHLFCQYKEVERCAIQQTKLAAALLRPLAKCASVQPTIAACEQSIAQLDKAVPSSDRTGSITSVQHSTGNLVNFCEGQKGNFGDAQLHAISSALVTGSLADSLWKWASAYFRLVQLVATLAVAVQQLPEEQL
mmetsp:Transcript_10839/g.16706  ORF Transcript_10839/g.16706 Transcript_10839/m.16706 type:complete len:138 (+) Transcript_10839:361-774(+)